MSAPAATASAVEVLTDRLLGTVADDGLAETAAMRVYDALGALAAARDSGAWPMARTPTIAAGAPPPAGSVSTGDLVEIARRCAVLRSSEVDDIDRQSLTTPAAVAVPVALALAADGDAVLRGVIAGYETMAAIGEAVDGPRALYRGIWPSYLAAPVAAAATAGVALGLPAERLVHALAIAAARVAPSLGRPVGEPTSRWLLFGWAVADGVMAVRAAAAGARGDLALLAQVLEHEGGDAKRLAGPNGSESATAAVARVDVKPFCTSRQGQAAVLAAQAAWAELADGGDAAETEAIIAVRVAVPDAYLKMIDLPVVTERLSSIASAQFQIAAALCDPARLYDVARRDVRVDDATAALMAATEVVADPELSAAYPEVWSGRVTIRTRDGRTASRLVPETGDAGPEPASWDTLTAKHTALCAVADLAALQNACRYMPGGGPIAAELYEPEKSIPTGGTR